MSSQTDLSPPASLWRNAEFLKFWGGQTISVFGSAITNLALPLLAVTTLNATAEQMGFLNAAATLPFLLFGLIAGAWIDRSRRRPIMLLSDLGRALLLGTIPLATALGLLRIELLYAVVFLVGVLTVFFDVSYQSFLPALVSRLHLVEGNSKLEISFSAAQIVGPGIAGGFIQLLSAPFAVALDAFSFLMSAFSLVLVRCEEPAPTRNHASRNVWKEIGEGLRVVFSNRMLWSIAGCTATSNFFSNVWYVVYVLYMTRFLNLSPVMIGVVFAAGAPGALLASLVSSKVVKRNGVGPVIIGSALIYGAAGLLVLLARGPIWMSTAMLILSNFLRGFSNILYNVNQVSLRQMITPDRLLGRMNATMRFLVWGTIPLGALAASVLSSQYGVQPTILVGVLGGLTGFLWVFFSPVRKLKEQPAAVT